METVLSVDREFDRLAVHDFKSCLTVRGEPAEVIAVGFDRRASPVAQAGVEKRAEDEAKKEFHHRDALFAAARSETMSSRESISDRLNGP